MSTQLRTGKLPVTDAPKVRLTRDMVAITTPPVPRSLWAVNAAPPVVRYDNQVPTGLWGMDANDRLGCCVIAEADHTTKLRQVAAGNSPISTRESEIIAAYSAITGYDPDRWRPDGTNPTDQGTVMQDARDYWRKNGLQFGGVRDFILLFAQLDHSDQGLVRWALQQFGALGVGFAFPDSAMDQFLSYKPWTVTPGPAPTSGHAVTLAGYDQAYAYVVTWGRVQRMSWDFFAKYVDEVWVDLDESFVNSITQQDPLALTLYQLGDQFKELTGQANPVPVPVAPPGPAPSGQVTVVFEQSQADALDRWSVGKLYSGTASARKAWKSARHIG